MNHDWRVVPIAVLAGQVVDRVRPASPAVIAVDGHSSSGKTTFAGRLAASLPQAAALHTDDLASDDGVFAWDVALLEEVLPVIRSGKALHRAPPRWWRARGLTGAVTLPASLAHLVVEGVGASQPSVRDAYDLVIWVETDEATRLARDQVRLAAGEMATPGAYEGWMGEENAYTTRERPWEHANLSVYGGDSVPHDPHVEVIVSGSWPGART